ncbi:MFS transporter [Streptomyces sp. NPDC019937]|uniref:MFS transporter n=1 Tax=Streptomyces sp. NPDC019937 TaxID=3154787 RepID=UPI0033C8A2C5
MTAHSTSPSDIGEIPSGSLRKVTFASCVGTTIEFYDFFIYATAAALVFPTVFFPALGPTAGVVASFATLGVAFVARPVGSVVFGHFGDRIGRKRSLVMTLLIMGLATTLIGFLPGSATLGVVAPIILVLLRAAQGFAVGGEWAGATLLTAEHAPAGRRGRYAVYPQLGPALGFMLSCVTFLVTGGLFGNTNQTFLDYGWRIPFIVSIALVMVGLWARNSVTETPEFQRAQAAAENHAGSPRVSPLVDVVRNQPRDILLAAGAITMQYSFFYMGTAFLTNYGTSPSGMGLSRSTVLSIGIFASVMFGAATIVAGRASDRFGRRPVITASCVSGLVWSLVLFPLLGLGGPFAFAAGLTVLLVIFGICFGPVGAFLPELFETRFRYTGAGLAFSLGGVLGGGVVPLVAPVLSTSFGGMAVGGMLAATALVSLVCVRTLPETKDRDVADGTTTGQHA